MKNDVIVVGAGPSGVSCALWLKQLGFSPVVVDRNDRCGGLQLLNAYANTWIATSVNVHGKDVAQAMHDNMVRHGVDMRLRVDAMEASRAGDGWGVRLSTGEIVSGRFLVLAAGVAPKTGGFAHRLGMILGPGHGVAKHPCCATAMADGVVAAKEIQRRLESDFASKFAGLARRTVSLAAKALA